MTLILQLEIFIDNENEFISSKNLISQLLIILSHCMLQSLLQTPGLQHSAGLNLVRKMQQDPFPLDLMGSNNEYTTQFHPTNGDLIIIYFIYSELINCKAFVGVI